MNSYRSWKRAHPLEQLAVLDHRLADVRGREREPGLDFQIASGFI